jgi:hypothetical protein
VSFMQAFIEPSPMVAYIPGLLIAVGVVLFFVLGAYAIWWMIFRMGK